MWMYVTERFSSITYRPWISGNNLPVKKNIYLHYDSNLHTNGEFEKFLKMYKIPDMTYVNFGEQMEQQHLKLRIVITKLEIF